MPGFKNAIYKIIRPLGGLKIARYLSRNHPKILMYHRFSESGGNGKLSVDTFRSQMEILSAYFHPMTMKGLIQAFYSGNMPDNAVVVTFDDGYYDFYEYAYPVLKEFDVPATLFLTTGFINKDLWLWPDKIRYAIAKANKASFNLPGFPTCLNLDNKDDAWNEVADHCMKVSNKEKNHLIKCLYHELDVVEPKNAPKEFESLTWGQVKHLIENGIEIGSHSYSHPIMTKLDEKELLEELSFSKEQIFDELGIEVDIFCYPNGQITDFDARVKDALLRAGYSYAVAAFPGRSPLSDLLAIKRYPVNSSISMYEKNVFGLSFLRF